MTDNRFRRLFAAGDFRPEEVLPPGPGSSLAEDEGSVVAQGAGSCAEGSPLEAREGAQPGPEAEVGPPCAEAAAGEGAEAAKPATEGTASEEPTVQDLTQELERVRAELAATRDQLLRAYAELDNFRKRVARQLEDERRYSELALLRDLLPVLDDIYRAVEAAESTANAGALKDGFRMVAEHLEQVLARHHCCRIEAEGQPFDPNFHEAVGQEPSETCPPNVVLRVLRTGYKLHDRVVRPAQVVVSLGKSPAPANN